MIKMVVFDLDGTLVDSLTDLAISVNKGLKAAGLEEKPLENYNRYVGNGRTMLVKRAMGEFAEDEEKFTLVLDVYNKEYALHCFDNTVEYDGCTEMLRALAENGIYTAVLSNKPDEFVGKIVANVFPTHSFTEAWGQKPQYKCKPDGESLDAMLSMHGVSKEECLYVGDSDVDVFTAQNAGVRMAGVEWGFRGREELLSAGAEFVASTAKELTDFILGENRD